MRFKRKADAGTAVAMIMIGIVTLFSVSLLFSGNLSGLPIIIFVSIMAYAYN